MYDLYQPKNLPKKEQDEEEEQTIYINKLDKINAAKLLKRFDMNTGILSEYDVEDLEFHQIFYNQPYSN